MYILKAIFHYLSPEYITTDLFVAVEKLVNSLKYDDRYYRKGYKLLLSRVSIWANANYDTQLFIFEKYKSYLSSKSLGFYYKDILRTHKLLTTLVNHYYINTEKRSVARKSLLTSEQLFKLRDYIFNLINCTLIDGDIVKYNNIIY